MNYKIYNQDCIVTMNNMEENSVDLIITSPPYNTNILVNLYEKGICKKTKLYDNYKDKKSEKEYLEWTCEIFNLYDKVLKEDSIVLYNFSYSTSTPSLPYLLISEIIKNTPFTIADTIIWKKKNSIPITENKNRLTRKTEFIFVICRKTELSTFKMNKKVKSEKGNHKYLEIFYNLLESENNNDRKNTLNKATFSTGIIDQLIKMYAFEGYTIYDSFNGTGTTGVSALKNNCNYIGSEISEEQCKYSIERIENIFKNE